ncbi:hypothetical protein OG883_42605 [Streptomyces sp. NBC_01142]|uniref:hypothetical protein n=1 Tax=Streptomyces sp. NBC_01142 TaxID=2975865 RepID=UPI0022583FDC|nr:hypothetical protein [Streptomyces sp. NBC_01142]MCX4826335.1 hypothetical protein [Streptomyces sp. NBC_01142]
MSISTATATAATLPAGTLPAAPAATAARAAAADTADATTAGPRRYPHIPALAGNANVRALLGQGIHPASRQPLTAAPGADCGNCALAYRIQLPTRVGDGGGAGSAGERLKCSKAPISRRGRQGIDLRPATSDQPATPACTLHCTFADWPYDPDGHDQTAADQIGTARDHADDWGIYAVYRIYGIDPEHQRAWVELEAEMVPYAAAPTGYIARPPHYSRPDKPHLYRFWTNLSRLHTAQLTHAADAGDCTHPLVRNGRILSSR